MQSIKRARRSFPDKTANCCRKSTDVKIDWPVIYINRVTREPLRVITRDDWHMGLAARYGLSHVTPGNHYFVDSSGQVFHLVGRGFLSPGFQVIDTEPVDCPGVVDLVRDRARTWPGLDTGSISEIIAEAARKKGGT